MTVADGTASAHDNPIPAPAWTDEWQRHAAAIRQSRRVQGSGYRAPKPSRPQPSFRDAGATVVSV
ncbi:hypothetical protein A8E92_03785 [Burkholderia cenocepacia]|nr:hypothetical protein A8E92_03785 [Burkholderia cenocepacia]